MADQWFFSRRWRGAGRRQAGRFQPTVHRLEDRTLLSFLAPLTQDVNGSVAGGGITTGDFLGNHIQDLAVTGGSSVSIFLGNGDGTFQAPLTIPVGPDAFALAAADLTRSGHDDLVVTHANEDSPGGSVSVLLSNGDGTFRPPVDYPAGDNPHSIALGDFNGDGFPDIVVANEGFFFHDQFQPGTTVTVLLSNGDGTFGAPQTFDTGIIPESVAVGDFTGDGRISIVTADNGFDTVPGDVGFLRGNGNGTFQEPVFLNVAPGAAAARSVAVADLTGTGKLGIVAAIEGPANGVSVILGNGNGTFRNGVTYPHAAVTDPLALHVSLGDFNGDGRPDIAITSFLGTDPGLDVLVNNGDGTFQPPTEILGGDSIGVMTVGDFTGDGSSDLAFASSLGGVAILLRQPGGLLKAPTNLSTGAGTSSLQTADLRLAGIADLIVANAQTNSVGVLLGNGDGSFQPQATYAVGNNPEEVIAADLLGNGIPDLVTANQDGQSLSVLLGRGDGTFQAAQTVTLTAPSNYAPVRVVAGDFERNGTVDLVVLEGSTTGAAGLILLHGHGDGTFTQEPFQTIAAQASNLFDQITFQAADLAGDGNLSLILAADQSGGGGVAILPGNGDGTFGPTRFLDLGTDLNDGITSVALADLRGIGVLDLVVSSFNLFRGDDVIVALGNGDGTFQRPVRYLATGAATSVVVGDFNGDGVPDVAVGEQGLLGGAGNLSTLSVLAGNGDGTFGPPTNYAATSVPRNLVTADFNGDGALDLALFNQASGNVSVVFNANDGTAPGRGAAVRLPHHTAARPHQTPPDRTLGRAAAGATPAVRTSPAPLSGATVTPVRMDLSPADGFFTALGGKEPESRFPAFRRKALTPAVAWEPAAEDLTIGLWPAADLPAA